MSLEQQVFAALGPLVANRVYPLVLPQSPSVPVTPAIKYQFISSQTDQDIFGDDGGLTANTRTQIDVFSTTHPAARALRLQIIAAMKAIATPTAWDGGFDDYDSELKLFRCSLDFTSYPSS
jgi:hypothetical protein